MQDNIEQMLFDDTVLKNILEELNHLKLNPKDYITIANHLLDLALNKSTISPSEPIISSNKKVNLPIDLDDISIRKFNRSKDAALLTEWTNNDYGREFLLSRIDNREITVSDILNDELNIFGIIEADDKIPIGVLGYLNYDKINNKSELRKLIGNKNYTGKGIAKKATNAWISYGITSLNLRKIYIYTYETNLSNIRINRELGFNLEGILKAENIYNGEAKDIVRMALIAK